MAITKIKPIRGTVNKALAYILDPQKTDDQLYVSSYGCAASDAAAKEFEWTRNLAAQQGMQMPKVIARHLIQSFAVDEVTPEQAHEIGKQFADEWLKGKYEYVIATHIDKGHCHNHIIFNAVNYVDFHFPCWRQTSLGCIIEPYSEKVYGEHDYEVLTSSREGLQRQEDHFGSKQRHDTDGYNIIPFGYCTYRNRSDDGKFAFNINTISEKAIVSKFYPVFRFTNANSTFMAEFLNSSPRVKKKLSVLAVGTSQVVLSFEALKAAKFDLPCKDEQDKIAAFLECLNTRIENQRTLVAALKKYAQCNNGALLYELFCCIKSIKKTFDEQRVLPSFSCNVEAVLRNEEIYEADLWYKELSGDIE